MSEKNETSYRTIADFAYDWELLIDQDGKPIYVSPSCERITGYSAKKFYKDPALLKKITHPKDLERLSQHIQDCIINEKQHKNIEFMIISATGQQKWIESRCQPVFKSDGSYLGRRVCHRDITERKQIENSLRKSEQLYREFVEGTDNLITQVNDQGTFTHVNHTAKKIFGYNPEECIGRPAFDFIYPEDRESTITAFNGWVKNKLQSTTYENRQQNQRTSQVSTMLWTINLHYDEHGNITIINGIARDITELRKAEEQLRLHQQQLKRIEQLSSMGELTSTLAHQLNQPLTIISSYAQESNRRLKNLREQQPDLTDAMEKIAIHSNRAGEILHRMRDFFSMKQLQKTPEDINLLIKDSIRLAEFDCSATKFITFDFDRSIPLVFCDKIQIEQVITNIVQNAIDATQTNSNKTPKIIIKTAINNGILEIIITDNGPGIEKSMLNNIFEPFFTTKPKEMGMGLAISRSIIEAHDGQISVSSEAGKGTQFKLKIKMGNKP